MSAETAAGAYPPIADYAAIGDGYTVALVGRDGGIDWCCMPEIDSGAVFCRLLDREAGGWFGVAPTAPASTARTYVGDTNVLATEYTTDTGRVRVTDFMPAAGGGRCNPPSIIRLVEGLSGQVEVAVTLRPTFDYARADTAVEPAPGGARARAGDDALTLRADVPMQADGLGAVTGTRRLAAGDRLAVTLSWGAGPAGATVHRDADRLLDETLAYWRSWAAQCTYSGPYSELVRRSALVLKLLTYRPTGAVVAAPTTSLPEDLGGERNWDYRYTWLRDASLILYALQTLGYHDEADGFFDWFAKLCIECRDRLQIMYTVTGGEELDEQILGHLDGYAGSRPVRIGNAAARQTQLDIFGGILDAAHLHAGAGRGHVDIELWELLRDVTDRAARRWTEPDEGIWEVRGPSRHFLYSKLLCWVALDRGLDIARTCGLPADVDHWERVRDEIRAAILESGYDADLGAFTQSFGEPTLDASALVVPLVGFLPAQDPRVASTVRAVQRQLTSHGLVFRYRTQETRDGLAGDEATFALCSFWLVENLALGGRVAEARDLFDRVVFHANDVGLLSEEIDPATGELLGNFPQGFTHLGLIRAALSIDRAERGDVQQHPERPAEQAGHVRP